MPLFGGGAPKDLREYAARDPDRVDRLLQLMVAQNRLADERQAAVRAKELRPPPKTLPLRELIEDALAKWRAADFFGAAVSYNAVNKLSAEFMPPGTYQSLLDDDWRDAKEVARTEVLLMRYRELTAGCQAMRLSFEEGPSVDSGDVIELAHEAEINPDRAGIFARLMMAAWMETSLEWGQKMELSPREAAEGLYGRLSLATAEEMAAVIVADPAARDRICTAMVQNIAGQVSGMPEPLRQQEVHRLREFWELSASEERSQAFIERVAARFGVPESPFGMPS